MTVELVVTPKSIDHIYELINVGADSFVIGEENMDYVLLVNSRETN